MARRSSILASDADRERVAERLRQAATEGRILAHELEERVARALRARTYGELAVLIDDLPRADTTPERRGSRSLRMARSHPVATVAVLVAVTLVLFVVAAAVVASFFFLGPLWIVLVVMLFARRGYQGERYGRYRRPPVGGRRGPGWVR